MGLGGQQQSFSRVQQEMGLKGLRQTVTEDGRCSLPAVHMHTHVINCMHIHRKQFSFVNKILRWF